MNREALLVELSERGVQLWADGEQLRVRAPKGVLTPELRAALTEQKAELLALLDHRKASGRTSIPLVPSPRDGNLPLSFAQQRLWLLVQLNPGSTIYNLPEAYRLKGRLNVAALEASLNEIVRRQEALRTTFLTVDGEPRQSIAPAFPLPLPMVDLQALSEEEREAEAQRLTIEDAERSFEISSGPLIRVTLVRLAEEEHWLLVVMHHIVSDGWSFEVFWQELTALYQASSAGQPSPLAALPIQYADFANWERQVLQGEQGEMLEAQLSYWKRQLSGAPPLLELPTDRPRPAVQTYPGAKQSLTLSLFLSDALKTLSGAEGLTLFMTLLAAFQTLLFRYTGQDDISVGIPIAGRNHSAVEGLIGFFIKTLVMRTDLSGNPSFREVLGRVREVALGAYNHQEVPFEKLVEELQPERSLSHTPLFNVFFNLLSYTYQQPALEGLSVEILSPWKTKSQFDLTLYAREDGGQLRFELVYNSDLFEAARMEELLAQFEQLLTRVVTCPEERLSQPSLITSSAAKRLPDPTVDLRCEWTRTVQEQLAQQAALGPDRVAVVDRHDTWSYGELERRSNQLAHALRAAGIQTQDIVAIYGHRSASLVWALLGVLKAGAAFMLVDPAYPAARLREYLRKVQPRGWLQLEAAGELPAELEEYVQTGDWSYRLVLPRRLRAAAHDFLGNYSRQTPEVTVGPDDVAYVAFTSGSTGTPKAVVGSGRPLGHFLKWYSQTFGLHEADRFSLVSGLAHDPVLRDIFGPLWLGATLYVPEPQDIQVPSRLLGWLQDKEISVVHLTPALGQLLTGGGGSSAEGMTEPLLPALRHVFFGGDVLCQSDVQRMRQLAPGARCVNFYGATETPQAMGYFVVPGAEKWDQGEKGLRENERLPLGQGIEGVQLLVLNAEQRLAGIGEVGEICIRTPYLARGYWRDMALTQERFVRNPYTHTAEDRLYKTGDSGRYLLDGQVEFLGRADRQVKVRGFRVELAEVEAVLTRHLAVQEAVVDARQEVAGEPTAQFTQFKGDTRLVAYVVPLSGPIPSVSVLLRFLREMLPEYMLPSAFVFLDALPLTPNGKLDRQALPEPEGLRPELDTSYEAPRSETEQTIAAVWQDVLGIEQVGRQDNFFDLGGHSLLLIQVRDKLQKILHREIPIIELFRHPTIHSLTHYALQAPSEQPDLQHSEDRAQTRKRALKQQQQLREKRKAMVSADGGQNEYSGNVRPS